MKIILSTICIALAGLFAYQLVSYPSIADAASNSKATLNSDLAQSLDYELPQLAVLKSIDQYSEIIERPLFKKSRVGQVSKRSVKKVSSVNELSHLILVGTARSSDVQVGIIADTKAKQMERLKVGENYKDWEIAEVAPDHIVFQNAKLEHKLYVTPIEGSQHDKQAKLIGKLNKSKIDRAVAAIDSYKDDYSDNDNNTGIKTNKKVAGKIWGKSSSSTYKPNEDDEAESKPVKRSPIKIPDEEERDAEYYEGNEDIEESDFADNEISAEDFYDDEDITEDELKALEALGAKIFDD